MSYTPTLLRSKTTYRFLTLYASPNRRGGWSIWGLNFAHDGFTTVAIDGELLDRMMVYNAVEAVSDEEIKKRLLEVLKLEEYAEAVKQYGDMLYSALVKLRNFIEGTEPYVNLMPVALVEEGSDVGYVILSRGYGTGGVRVRYRPIKTGTLINKLGFVKIKDLIAYYLQLYKEVGRPYVSYVTSRTDPDLFNKIYSKRNTDVDTIIDIVMDRLGAGTVPSIYVHCVFVDGSDNYYFVDAKRLILMPNPANITAVAVLQCNPTTILVFKYKVLKPEEVTMSMLKRDLFITFLRKPGAIDRRLREVIAKKIEKVLYGEPNVEETTGLEVFFGEGEEAAETAAAATTTAAEARAKTVHELESEILGGVESEAGAEMTAELPLEKKPVESKPASKAGEKPSGKKISTIGGEVV